MYYSSRSHKAYKKKQEQQRNQFNKIIKMNKIKNDIESSVWIHLYIKLNPNTTQLITMALFGWLLTYFMYAGSLLDDHEAICFVGGSAIALIGFAFLFGFIHLMTGRDIRIIATKNMVEPSEVQEIAQNIYR